MARETRQMRLQQGLTYTLAQLISYATHDPKKMPKFSKVFPEQGTPKQQSPDEIFEAMHEWAALLAANEGPPK